MASFALGSTLITRVLHEAAGASTMAGSYATPAPGVAATVGPVIAAATISTEAGLSARSGRAASSSR